MNVLGRSVRTSTVGRRDISQWVQVPVIFTGLLVTLWSWKSFMLVLFQRRIIFMPYIGRHERLEDHVSKDVCWTHHPITTPDRVRLSLCHSPSSLPNSRLLSGEGKGEEKKKRRRIRLVYLQGNAGSTPPRLPPISRILRRLRARDLAVEGWTVAYRGYWTSSGSPSEAGLRRDVAAAIKHIVKLSDEDDRPVETIIWGHSIGATLALDALCSIPSHEKVKIILETPFDAIASLLVALYPQRWLPYRYLAPLLVTRFDLPSLLSSLCRRRTIKEGKTRVLLVRATEDEIVPERVHDKVDRLLRDSDLFHVEAVVCSGLHQNLIFKSDFQDKVVAFITADKRREEEEEEGEKDYRSRG